MFAKSFTTTTAIATHEQQPQQQQETAANFIYHVPLRLQGCCSARLVELLNSFSAELQIFFQRSNLVLANTQAHTYTHASFISQLTTRAHVLFSACLYAAIHIFFNEYYHKITYANTHILKSTQNTQKPRKPEYPWQLGKDLAICLCCAYKIFRLST